jgi:hypothetical protein
MRYKQKIMIDRPVDQVVQLFDSPANMMKWFPGLVSFEPLSGEPGQPGARSRMLFKMNRGEFELIETITVNNLPNELSASYKTVGKGISNTISTHFLPVSKSSTRYESEIDYKFNGFKWKLLSPLVRFLFKRQSANTMWLFKEFVESDPDERSAHSGSSGDVASE